MAWTTPGTATAGEVLTAAFWNANVRDNLNEIVTPAYGIATAENQVLLTTAYQSMLSVTITASGIRPVLVTWSVSFQEGGSGSSKLVEFQTYAAGSAVGVSTGSITAFFNSNFGQASGQYIEKPAAGSRTYAVYGKANNNSSVYYDNRTLVVTEI
jgi:hypothetical protein